MTEPTTGPTYVCSGSLTICKHCSGKCQHCLGTIGHEGKPGRPKLFCCPKCRNSTYKPTPDFSTKACGTCNGECSLGQCDGQVQAVRRAGMPWRYCCPGCGLLARRQSEREALASISLKPCEQCKGECTHCDGLQASSRAKYCCEDCKRLAKEDRALEMQHYLDTIWYNEAAKQRILKGNHREYLARFYPPKPKKIENTPATPLTRAKR